MGNIQAGTHQILERLLIRWISLKRLNPSHWIVVVTGIENPERCTKNIADDLLRNDNKSANDILDCSIGRHNNFSCWETLGITQEL